MLEYDKTNHNDENCMIKDKFYLQSKKAWKG